MKINLINRLLTVLLVAGLLLTLTGAALADDPAPQSVTYYSELTLYSGNGITSSPTGMGSNKPEGFGVQDCYQILDVTLNQTVTGKIESSPDNVNWFTHHIFAAVSADNVAFTRTTIYGAYQRYAATLGTTNPVTVSLKCVVKDN